MNVHLFSITFAVGVAGLVMMGIPGGILGVLVGWIIGMILDWLDSNAPLNR